MSAAFARWRAALRSGEFARSAFCIAIGTALQIFTCVVFYVVYFSPPPLCDVYCILESFAPSLSASLWAIWLLAWHLPRWRETPLPGRGSIIAQCVGIPIYIGAILYW